MSTGREGLQRLPLPLTDAHREWAARPGRQLGRGGGVCWARCPPPRLLPRSKLSWLSSPHRSGRSLRPLQQGNLGDPAQPISTSLGPHRPTALSPLPAPEPMPTEGRTVGTLQASPRPTRRSPAPWLLWPVTRMPWAERTAEPGTQSPLEAGCWVQGAGLLLGSLETWPKWEKLAQHRIPFYAGAQWCTQITPVCACVPVGAALSACVPVCTCALTCVPVPVSMCRWVHVHVCTYRCSSQCVCPCVHMCTHVCACAGEHVSVGARARVYLWVQLPVRAAPCARVPVCTCVSDVCACTVVGHRDLHKPSSSGCIERQPQVQQPHPAGNCPLRWDPGSAHAAGRDAASRLCRLSQIFPAAAGRRGGGGAGEKAVEASMGPRSHLSPPLPC